MTFSYFSPKIVSKSAATLNAEKFNSDKQGKQRNTSSQLTSCSWFSFVFLACFKDFLE